jgi:hypothetical protein
MWPAYSADALRGRAGRDARPVRKLMIEHIDETDLHLHRLDAAVRRRFVFDSELCQPIAPQ